MAFLEQYFEDYRRLALDQSIEPALMDFVNRVKRVKDAGGKLMFGGNGASASLAGHGASDFTKQGGVRGVTFHDPGLMTCFANDFGYDHWLARAFEHYADDGDIAVLISVSGESPSVVNAAHYARERGMQVVSFTGRAADNTLKQASDVAFHVASDAYNIVECIHGIWLTAAIDCLIGSAIYETRADGS